MGRRKWKLYQASISRNCLQPINNNVENIKENEEYIKEQADYSDFNQKRSEADVNCRDIKEEVELTQLEEEDRLKDWSPQSKCYFCVDGKLDSENSTSHGALVRPFYLIFTLSSIEKCAFKI